MSDTHLEIERRLLIRRPGEALLRSLGGTVSRIRQDYLLAPEGVTDRVRSRTGAGGTVYTRTVKHRLTGMTREETEREIGEDRKSTRLNSSHPTTSRMPSSA